MKANIGANGRALDLRNLAAAPMPITLHEPPQRLGVLARTVRALGFRR